MGYQQTHEQATGVGGVCRPFVYVGFGQPAIDLSVSEFPVEGPDIRGSRNATVADFRTVLALMESGRYPVSNLVSAHYPLEQADHAFSDWASDPGAYTKILIDL